MCSRMSAVAVSSKGRRVGTSRWEKCIHSAEESERTSPQSPKEHHRPENIAVVIGSLALGSV